MELGGGSPCCLCLQTMLILFLLLGGKPAVGFNPNLNVSFSESGSLLVQHCDAEIFWDTFTNHGRDAFLETGARVFFSAGPHVWVIPAGKPTLSGGLMELRFADLHRTVPPTAAWPPPPSHTFPFTLHTPVTWGFTLASPGFGQAEQFRNNDGREKGGNKATQEWQQALLRLQWMPRGIQHDFLKDSLLHP